MVEAQIQNSWRTSATLCDIEDALKTSHRIGDYRSVIHWAHAFIATLVTS